MSMTALQHGLCDGGYLAQDSTGHVYCSVCGTEDVPIWSEIEADIESDERVVVHPANHVLYVVTR